MTRYAEQTAVAAEKSRAEIERTLQRYGAEEFMYGWLAGSAVIGFKMKGRIVRMVLPLPDKDDRHFARTPGGRRSRSAAQVQTAWEQACRQSWRALALIVKAKLEAVAAGISTFEREFLADTVLPSGQTVSEWLEPQIDECLADSIMPGPILLALTAGAEATDDS